MFGRVALKRICTVAPKVARPQIRTFSAAPATPASDNEVVTPELVESLEWLLSSPPSIHQFNEPPIIVEIEHLTNLVVADD